jgi:hypothetical protein
LSFTILITELSLLLSKSSHVIYQCKIKDLDNLRKNNLEDTSKNDTLDTPDIKYEKLNNNGTMITRISNIISNISQFNDINDNDNEIYNINGDSIYTQSKIINISQYDDKIFYNYSDYQKVNYSDRFVLPSIRDYSDNLFVDNNKRSIIITHNKTITFRPKLN